MGEFDHLDRCPKCGKDLQGFGCVYCNVEYEMGDGVLVERTDTDEDTGRRCIACDTPLTRRAELTMAWEDGDNENAYLTCQDCGFKNDF